jgi:predicted lipoprotein with Yx(FWY)xxD motif
MTPRTPPLQADREIRTDHAFSYLGTSIPAGVTIRGYRAARPVRNPRRRRPLRLVAAVAVVVSAALVAGCGGGSGGDGAATASPAPPKTANGRTATVGVATTGLGKILVDSKGRTLYLFQKDTGTKSSCAGPCASDWPPLRASGNPTVGRGTNASLVATTTRSDGKPQVSYNGHPLYLYAGDEKAGDTEGQGLTTYGAAWYALSPAGNPVTGGASTSGGGGY